MQQGVPDQARCGRARQQLSLCYLSMTTCCCQTCWICASACCLPACALAVPHLPCASCRPADHPGGHVPDNAAAVAGAAASKHGPQCRARCAPALPHLRQPVQQRHQHHHLVVAADHGLAAAAAMRAVVALTAAEAVVPTGHEASAVEAAVLEQGLVQRPVAAAGPNLRHWRQAADAWWRAVAQHQSTPHQGPAVLPAA